jgi:hypothetical protein
LIAPWEAPSVRRRLDVQPAALACLFDLGGERSKTEFVDDVAPHLLNQVKDPVKKRALNSVTDPAEISFRERVKR